MPGIANNTAAGPPLLDRKEFNGYIEDGTATTSSAPKGMVRFEVDEYLSDGRKSGATFDIYKRFVCYHSPVFRRAFKGGPQQMDLDDTCPNAFRTFVRWLYTQNLLDGKKSWPSCEELIELWIIGDLAQIPKLQNRVLQVLESSRIVKKEQVPASKFFRIYQKTQADSPLRRYIANVLILENLIENDTYPPQLLVDIAKVLAVQNSAMKASITLLIGVPAAPGINLKHYEVKENGRPERKQPGAAPHPSRRSRKQKRRLPHKMDADGMDADDMDPDDIDLGEIYTMHLAMERDPEFQSQMWDRMGVMED